VAAPSIAASSRSPQVQAKLKVSRGELHCNSRLAPQLFKNVPGRDRNPDSPLPDDILRMSAGAKLGQSAPRERGALAA
jgi:hypothetical protein